MTVEQFTRVEIDALSLATVYVPTWIPYASMVCATCTSFYCPWVLGALLVQNDGSNSPPLPWCCASASLLLAIFPGLPAVRAVRKGKKKSFSSLLRPRNKYMVLIDRKSFFFLILHLLYFKKIDCFL